MAKVLSTPIKESAISSSCFNLVVYVSNVSRLAPGLAADMAEGVKLAAELIDGGAAYKKLEAFVEASNL